MDIPMYSVDALRSMEVIEINTGAKLGSIKDLKVDCENYRIVAIVLPSSRSGFFGRKDNIEIPFEKITKIGLDVILVDAGDEMIQEEIK